MRKLLLLLAVTALVTGTGAAASAASPGPGSSTGRGSVFVPNPVQSLGDESLTDQKDADAAVPAAAYHDVTLTNLDGSGHLSGDYATIVSETGNPAFSSTNTFRYTRHQDEFEQVMAYYWITEAQKYIQGLGFGVSLRPIDNQPQAVRINQLGQDNSFATDHPKNELRFGKGGVDDAEDAEVILHEYGHAIHFSQNFSFASEQAGAISEGFGDYWAVTVADVVTRGLGVSELEPLACVADWDSTSYTSSVPHCLRRVDTNLHYPADLNGEVHHDGQIWSRALWDIRQALGHVKADTIILQGSFDFPGTGGMPDLATRTVAAAQQLYGNAAAKAVRTAFAGRGILAGLSPGDTGSSPGSQHPYLPAPGTRGTRNPRHPGPPAPGTPAPGTRGTQDPDPQDPGPLVILSSQKVLVTGDPASRPAGLGVYGVDAAFMSFLRHG